VLRRIAAELDRSGEAGGTGPFDVSLSNLGVRARRREGQGRIAYDVTDPTKLNRWMLSTEGVKLSGSDVEVIAGYLSRFADLLVTPYGTYYTKKDGKFQPAAWNTTLVAELREKVSELKSRTV
jgi:hypothetical protein